MTHEDTLAFPLPGWLQDSLQTDADFSTQEARMKLVIDLARRNVDQKTGGPFGAAVFELHSHRLVAVGVNIVEQSCWSSGHAEVVALALAQRKLRTFDLGGAELPAHELVSSVEPCVMCLGATLWSGVRRLVCGARDEDARAIGFDEGPKPPGWAEQLEARGIQVVRDLLRPEAKAVLDLYAQSGGTIYNARRGSEEPARE
jgi:tRNA(Arg) A34 adenosine deaminase TadA